MVSQVVVSLPSLYHEDDETAWLEVMASGWLQNVVSRRSTTPSTSYKASFSSDMARRDRREVYSRLVSLADPFAQVGIPARRSDRVRGVGRSWSKGANPRACSWRAESYGTMLIASLAGDVSGVAREQEAAAETGLPLARRFHWSGSGSVDELITRESESEPAWSSSGGNTRRLAKARRRDKRRSEPVGRGLNRKDWGTICPVTDDFVFVPADGSGYFGNHYDDIVQSVPADRLALLRSRGLGPRPMTGRPERSAFGIAPHGFVISGRYAMALRTAGGSGASGPLTARQRISLSAKSSILSYSLKSIRLERSAP